MPQTADWFAANAPKAEPGADWFAANAAKPAPAATSAPVSASRRVGELPAVRLGFERETPVEGLIGAGKGLMSTVFHGGDWIRSAFGLDRVIDRPEVQAGIAPASEGESRGFAAEQMGEYIPAGARGLSWAKTSGLFGKLVKPALLESGVAGMQTGGDPEAVITTAGLSVAAPALFMGARGGLNMARNAAAGAKDGGLGGAVSALVRRTAPLEPVDLMTRGLKPAAKLTKWDTNVKLGMREINAVGRPIANVDDLLTSTDLAKKRVWSQYEQMAGPARARGMTVDLAPVAEAMERSIPRKLQIENPGAAVQLQEAAQVYRQRFSLQDAERLLLETNAELEGFYGKYPASQRRALASDPYAARLNAQAKTLRDAIYKTLDGPGEGAAARQLKQRYGALLEIETEAYRRANVAARQQPESLSEQFSTARAALDVARGTWKLLHGNLAGGADIVGGYAMRDTARFMREQQTTDTLVRRAFASFKELPEPVMMPTHRPPAGLLERGPLVTPAPTDRSGRVYDLPLQVSHPSPQPKALPRGAIRLGESGSVAPAADPSGVRPWKPAVIEHQIETGVPVKEGGYRPIYSSDPNATEVPLLARDDVRKMLERMETDLNEFMPQRGRLGRTADLTESHYSHGGKGSGIVEDMRILSGTHDSGRDFLKAVRELLDGQRPTNKHHVAALDAALGYLEKRAGYKGPYMSEDAYDAFSKMVDDFADGEP